MLNKIFCLISCKKDLTGLLKMFYPAIFVPFHRWIRGSGNTASQGQFVPFLYIDWFKGLREGRCGIIVWKISGQFDVYSG